MSFKVNFQFFLFEVYLSSYKLLLKNLKHIFNQKQMCHNLNIIRKALKDCIPRDLDLCLFLCVSRRLWDRLPAEPINNLFLDTMTLNTYTMEQIYLPSKYCLHLTVAQMYLPGQDFIRSRSLS